MPHEDRESGDGLVAGGNGTGLDDGWRIMLCLILLVSLFTMDGIKPEVPYPECSNHAECPSFGCYEGYCDPENGNCYVRPRCV